jgi:hypothetical protein
VRTSRQNSGRLERSDAVEVELEASVDRPASPPAAHLPARTVNCASERELRGLAGSSPPRRGDDLSGVAQRVTLLGGLVAAAVEDHLLALPAAEAV